MFKQAIWSVLLYELFLQNTGVNSLSFMSDKITRLAFFSSYLIVDQNGILSATNKFMSASLHAILKRRRVNKKRLSLLLFKNVLIKRNKCVANKNISWYLRSYPDEITLYYSSKFKIHCLIRFPWRIKIVFAGSLLKVNVREFSHIINFSYRKWICDKNDIIWSYFYFNELSEVFN